MRIAFIGLGHMGAPMASNLQKAGHEVAGFDLSAVAARAAGVPLAGSGVAAVERRPAPAAPARAAALDPRQGCQNLNFFSAARCEAAHCDQPAYTRHPRCNEVRADRRRDEARRNPMLGT